jgi:hypothetical protein
MREFEIAYTDCSVVPFVREYATIKQLFIASTQQLNVL